MKELGHLRNYEATLRRKNGSPIHVLINAFGLYSNSGELVQIRGLMLDVTGLRTYQSELHRERDFSEKILNNTQSMILVADTAGLISYANRRWIDAGFQLRDLLGGRCWNWPRPASYAHGRRRSEHFERASGGQPGITGVAWQRSGRAVFGQSQPHARRAGNRYQHRRGFN